MSTRCKHMPLLAIEALLIARVRNAQKVVFARAEIEKDISALLKSIEQGEVDLNNEKVFRLLSKAIDIQDRDEILPEFKHLTKVEKIDIAALMYFIKNLKQMEEGDNDRSISSIVGF